MDDTTLEQLRYPIGRPDLPATGAPIDRSKVDSMLDDLAAHPAALRSAVEGLDEDQLETPYRPGGWTVRQVVHHVPDSHVNAYIRTKWALTEDEPTIKIYHEARWAALPDSKGPIDVPLDFLDVLHRRWVPILRGLDEETLRRRLVHPEMGPMDLHALVHMYHWHGRHHVAHVTGLAERMGWS